MIQQFNIQCIIGVNLTRTASTIYNVTNKTKKCYTNIKYANNYNNIESNCNISYKIPYILVIAGTDANITL